MVNQIKLLFELISDYRHSRYREVPWGTIALAVGAVLYFLSPIDLIPDVINEYIMLVLLCNNLRLIAFFIGTLILNQKTTTVL